MARGIAFADMPATLRDSIAMVKLERKALLDTDRDCFDEEIEYGIIDMPDSVGPDYYDHHRYSQDASPDGAFISGFQAATPLWVNVDGGEEED